MIRCHLATLMDQRKLRVTEVARLTGLNRSTITALYRDCATRIELPALERLCALFDCGVENLLEQIQGSTGSAP